MKFFKKIIVYIKNIFCKKENIKMLEKKYEKIDFVKSLKIDVTKQYKEKKIDTLVCEGDGLGIQRKMTY